MPNELLLETGDNLLLEDDTGSYPYSFLLLETGYDPSPYLRTGTGKAVTQVNDHGASSPGPFSWSGSTLGETGYNAVSGSANNGADTYALKFDTGEILPASGVITGIEIKVTAYSPAATLDLQTLAYGPYAAIYKNGTYQSSSGAGQYLTTSAAEYTIGGSSNALGVTWAAGDTIDIALWVNLYDNVGTTPNCYITAATMQIWYSIGGTTQTITVTVASATASASAPTVTPAATVTMPTASSTAAAIVPTVTPGATSITIGTCSAAAAASAPTLTPSVTIVSPTASATASASTPAITAGTSTITVTTASATGSATTPTITPTVDIASATASATAAATAPSVTAGATTITVTTGTATAAATAPDVTNATLITPDAAQATATASTLTVTPGGATIVVTAATATAATVDVTVQAGTTTITVGVASAVAGVASLDIVVAGEAVGSLLFTAYVTATIRGLASLQPSLDADTFARPSVEGKVL